MEPEGSIPNSQVPTACLYPEPARSNPYPPSHFLKIHLNIILPATPGSSGGLFPFRFPHQNPVYTSPPYALHAPPIEFFSILSPEQYWVITDHKAPNYVVISIPLLPCPFYAQIFSSTPYSHTPSAYVPPSV